MNLINLKNMDSNRRIKQIIPLPDHLIALIERPGKDITDENYYESALDLGVNVYIVLKEEYESEREIDRVTYGFIYPEGKDTIGFHGIRLIPRYKCKECANWMTVKPFKKTEEPEYYCPVCGWK